jgi:hypothetical protein
MHPMALTLALEGGITEAHARKILEETAIRNPMLLVGGFNSDYVIIALWLALYSESIDNELTDDDINRHLDAALEGAYAGLI